MSVAPAVRQDAAASGPRVWRLSDTTRSRIFYGSYLERFGRPLQNSREIDDAERLAYQQRFGNFEPGGDPIRLFPPMDRPWPADIVRPRVRLAPGFSLDIFHNESLYFVSARLREAMALPAEAVQYIPVEYEDTPDDVRAVDYRWLAWVNVERDVIAWDRCVGRLDECTNAVTGEVELRVGPGIRTIAVRDGFQPRFDLFSPYGNTSAFCATHTLEERVRAARLNGVGFDEYGCEDFVTPFWRSDERGPRVVRPGELDE